MKKVLSIILFIAAFNLLTAKTNDEIQLTYKNITILELHSLKQNCEVKEIVETEDYYIYEVDGTYYICYK